MKTLSNRQGGDRNDPYPEETANYSVIYSYIYSGGKLMQMSVGEDTFRFTYDASGTPLTITWGDTGYYYTTNLQGDVVAILDGNGTAVVTYTYDAWGNIVSTGGTMASSLGTTNPLRYRGYVYDGETGLYYLQSRYYDSEIGRFINADSFASTGQGLLGNNMFAYCGNNPIIYTDNAGYARCHFMTCIADGGSDWDDDEEHQEQDHASPVANFVERGHIKKAIFDWDFGIFGAITLTHIITTQDKEAAFFYVYSDVGHDADSMIMVDSCTCEVGTGINVADWTGCSFGANSEMYLFMEWQSTPYLHKRYTVGIDGVGYCVGWDFYTNSIELEIRGGLGTWLCELLTSSVPQKEEYEYYYFFPVPVP